MFYLFLLLWSQAEKLSNPKIHLWQQMITLQFLSYLNVSRREVWTWLVLGLILNGMNFGTLMGNAGAGTSAYLVAVNLVWIGVMVLLGAGLTFRDSRGNAHSDR
jgi:hypothetical protein